MKTIIAAVLITASRAFAFDSFDQSQREVRDLEDVPAANARSIDDRLDVEIRAALVACVADEGPIAREKLFIEAAKSFGYPNVGKKLRSRFNKALNALDHTGRVRTDWTTVWLPASETSAQLRLQDALNGNSPLA
jgi:hypothetical protein